MPVYYSIFLIFIGWFSDPEPRPKPQGKILWNDSNKVTIECFQGVADASSFARSYSSSGVEMVYSCKNNFFQPYISAYFDCGQAWVKDFRDPNLLALEQLKFDIAHYHAIKLQKQISGINHPCNMRAKDIEAMLEAINEECHKMQSQAEQMSEYGKEVSVLEMWDLKIEIEIETMITQNKLKGFASK